MDGGVVIVGAGGHSLVAIEVLRAAGLPVAGCVTSDGVAHAPLTTVDATILGTEDELLGHLHAATVQRVFVAIGDNRARHRVTSRLATAGARLVNAVSPAAHVSPSATLGDGVLVMPGAILNAASTIGDGVIVNTGASVDHECVVGAFTHIAPAAALAGRVSVGAGTLVGIGAAVAPGVAIGEWSVVGAGATVVADVGDHQTVVGTPARPVGQ